MCRSCEILERDFGGSSLNKRKAEMTFYVLGMIGLIISYGIAVETLADAVSYVPDYFRDKWGHDDALVALGVSVPPRDKL